MMSGESATIRKSRLLRIGMTKAEVEAVMGPAAMSIKFGAPPAHRSPYKYPPRASRQSVSPFRTSPVIYVEAQNFATTAEQWQLAAHRHLATGMSKLGFRDWSTAKPYPVSVSYDADGVAGYIRRGSKEVGR